MAAPLAAANVRRDTPDQLGTARGPGDPRSQCDDEERVAGLGLPRVCQAARQRVADDHDEDQRHGGERQERRGDGTEHVEQSLGGVASRGLWGGARWRLSHRRGRS